MFACAEWENLSGINRNIVECKVKVLDMIQEAYVVLIETSWNVKIISLNSRSQNMKVLIETSWNVKTVSEQYGTWAATY